MCAAALSVSPTVGCGGFELPQPPDMSALVDSYENPSGDLNADNVKDVAAGIVSAIQAARNGAPIEDTDAMVGALQKVGGGTTDTTSGTSSNTYTDDYKQADVGAGEQTVAGSKIDIGASIKLRRICRGWEDSKQIDANVNGTVELNVALDQGGLLPTVWGRLERCRVKRDNVNIEMTGDVRVHFGSGQPRVGLQDLSKAGYLVEIQGDLKATRDGAPIDVGAHISYWVFANGHVHLNVVLADDTNVVFGVNLPVLLPTADPDLGGAVLGHQDTWACQVSLANDNGSCINDEDAAMVVKW